MDVLVQISMNGFVILLGFFIGFGISRIRKRRKPRDGRGRNGVSGIVVLLILLHSQNHVQAAVRVPLEPQNLPMETACFVIAVEGEADTLTLTDPNGRVFTQVLSGNLAEFYIIDAPAGKYWLEIEGEFKRFSLTVTEAGQSPMVETIPETIPVTESPLSEQTAVTTSGRGSERETAASLPAKEMSTHVTESGLGTARRVDEVLNSFVAAAESGGLESVAVSEESDTSVSTSSSVDESQEEDVVQDETALLLAWDTEMFPGDGWTASDETEPSLVSVAESLPDGEVLPGAGRKPENLLLQIGQALPSFGVSDEPVVRLGIWLSLVLTCGVGIGFLYGERGW